MSNHEALTDVGRERPVPHPDLPTWSNRYTAALVRYAEAKARAEAARHDEELARAALDAQGDVGAHELAMAGDLCLMLRKANEYSGRALRQELTAIVGDVVEGLLNEFRNDLVDIAEAVARLERRPA